jgi:hypothetical protein
MLISRKQCSSAKSIEINFWPTARFDLTHPLLEPRRLGWMVDDILTSELLPAATYEDAYASCATRRRQSG